MAAPQRKRRVRSSESRVSARPAQKGISERLQRERQRRRKAAIRRRRRFVALVVVPVLLMLGNVYVHKISNDLDAKTKDLRQQQARVEANGERLQVRVAQLSRPERVRTLAHRELNMKDPGSQDMKFYSKHGEDGENGQQKTRGGNR